MRKTNKERGVEGFKVEKVDKRLGDFLGDLEKGLKAYGGIKGLRRALNGSMQTKQHKNNETEYIFDIVCAHYSLPERVLRRPGGHGTIRDAKKHIYCLLHFSLGFTIRYISGIFNYTSHNSVGKVVRYYKVIFVDKASRLKQDKEFEATYDLLNTKLLEYIKNQKQ